jgi:hypothetical protein
VLPPCSPRCRAQRQSHCRHCSCAADERFARYTLRGAPPVHALQSITLARGHSATRCRLSSNGRPPAARRRSSESPPPASSQRRPRFRSVGGGFGRAAGCGGSDEGAREQSNGCCISRASSSRTLSYSTAPSARRSPFSRLSVANSSSRGARSEAEVVAAGVAARGSSITRMLRL